MKITHYLKSTLCLTAAVALVGCAGTHFGRSTGRYIDDASTTARVKAAISRDSLVKATEIDVTTYRGNVHLTGYVDHPVQKDRAAQIARNVEGVEYFKNDILVKSELPATGITSGGQPVAEPAGASRDYRREEFSTRGGAANNGWQKGTVRVPAPEVAADLSVRPSPGVSVETSTSNGSAGRLNTQLRNDYPAAKNLHVETSANGIMILRGTVGSYADKHAIETRIRAMPGVKDVNNKLEVRP